MPTGSLPAKGKALWEKVYDDALKGSCDGDKSCAAQRAWGAVKRAGWEKDSEGNWHKRSAYSTFSLTITKASYDKVENRMNWRAVASDTEEDDFGDNMTLELFEDFKMRIESGEAPQNDAVISEFWSGGNPYVSLSHYPDLNGKAVPGAVERIYTDGNRLKAVGYFYDNDLGRACFKSVCKDIYNREEKHPDGPIRISIAFLDYMHRHKSNGKIFDVTQYPICMECVRESELDDSDGIEFMKGHLIHLALTRVPVNKRTSMEVTRSMAIETRKDDALSIVEDPELVAEIAEEAQLRGKSKVEDVPNLVTKSDEDAVVEETQTEEAPVEEPVEEPATEEATMSDILKAIEAIKELSTAKEDVEEAPAETHPLDDALANFRSVFDRILATDGITPDDALVRLQEPFEAMVENVRSVVRSSIVVPEPDANQLMLNAMEEMKREMAEMKAQMSNRSAVPEKGAVRRSFVPPAPTGLKPPQPTLHNRPSGVKSIAEIVEQTT